MPGTLLPTYFVVIVKEKLKFSDWQEYQNHQCDTEEKIKNKQTRNHSLG